MGCCDFWNVKLKVMDGWFWGRRASSQEMKFWGVFLTLYSLSFVAVVVVVSFLWFLKEMFLTIQTIYTGHSHECPGVQSVSKDTDVWMSMQLIASFLELNFKLFSFTSAITFLSPKSFSCCPFMTWVGLQCFMCGLWFSLLFQ